MTKHLLNRGLLILATLFSGVAMLAQPVCNQYDYYYADITNPPSGRQTDIYAVSFGGGDATLTLVAEDLPYSAHIAFNQIDKLIYVVDDANGDIRTLDPISGNISAAVSPSISLTKVTVAAFNATGKLLIGSGSNGMLYQADMSSDPYGVLVYDSGADISGGDITWTNNGLFLASKPNGYLYSVLPGMLNVLQGSVNAQVTGLATMADGENIVVSSVGNSSFVEYAVGSGVSEVNSYAAMLNGEAFTLGNGDMTSGCSGFADNTGCQDFQYFYINNNGPDVPTGTVMSGTIVGGDFVLTSLFDSGISGGHLAVNTDNGDFYVVRSNRIKTFSSTGDLLTNISISGLPGSVVAAVWNPADNLVYVGSSGAQKVYAVNPTDGSFTVVASNIPVHGGDLILNDAGELFLVRRSDNSPSKLYNISSGSPVFVADVNKGANGAAITSDGSGFIVARGDGGSTFNMYAADGTPGAILNAVDNIGNPMTLKDGDMASGCFGGSTPSESSCTYSMYYAHYSNPNKSELMKLTINSDNSVTSSSIANLDYGTTSLAVSPQGLLYVPSRWGTGFFTVWNANDGTQVGGQIEMTDASGDNIPFGGGATYHNGLLYVNALPGTIYALDPVTGVAQFELPGDTDGSDLVFDESGTLWLISRNAGIMYNVTAGTSFSLPLNNIDGIALLDNGNLAAVNGDNGTSMYEIDQNAEALTGNVFTLDFNVRYGDLASACVENHNDEIPGNCYATEVIEYVEGTSHSGGSIALNRTDASKALGAPERVDELVFVSLGYGGSLTLAFDGSIPNGPGDDIEVVETTYNNNSCASYPEFADVYVSVDGISWIFAKTVCRADGMIDISDADPTLTYVNYVKIVNNDELSTTPDAFDVDGVVALHNCEEAPAPRPQAIEANDSMTSYPSPTTGPATIEFEAANTGKSTLDIIDMNGRLIRTIFNENVVSGQTYTVDFNGSDLPNGIYITKLTTDSEIVVGKIMIAK